MQVKTAFGLPLPKQATELSDASRPFRILVMGDFGSDRNWGEPVKIDRDNFENVFAGLNPGIRISGQTGLPNFDIPLKTMQDFHPDQLFEKLDLFTSLRESRERLENDATFAEEARAIIAAKGQTNAGKSGSQAAATEPKVDASNLFDQMLEQTEASRRSVVDQIAEGSLNIDELVRQTIAPHIVDKADPRQAEFVAGVDEAISDAMRRVLHHPAFQNQEAAWLGMKMLIRRLETGPDLQIFLLNVSKPQLATDLIASDDLARSRLYRLLVDTPSVAGTESWTVVIGNYTFDAGRADTEVLGRIAQIHAAANAIFVAGASPCIVGCTDLAESADPHDWNSAKGESTDHWQALRALPAAAHVALALPRILARYPYGEASDPIDSFGFEEMPDGQAHNEYLWMNAAFGIATLLGRSFSEGGWSLGSDWNQDLEDLPVFFYTENGASKIKPCGEAELVLRAGGALFDAGLTPVYSIRDQGAVRIPSLRSLSGSGKQLSASWE